jgi:feruloyl esterase
VLIKINSSFWVILFGAILLGLPTVAAANSCESLAALKLPDTAITLAQPVAAGAFNMPGLAGQTLFAALTKVELKDLPAFCRIAITIKPSTDSDIKVEVWMPASGWNGKFMAVGNGGWAGTISYATMTAPLAHGYATASTDTGHEGTGGDGSFALGHPEKLIDFGYRAVHEMTVKAKAIIAAYYGQDARLNYWNGCSTGGRQGLKEAQRFPADFDGIVAGAPANNWTHLMAQSLWIAQAVHKNEASYIPPEKYPLIHNAVLQACDARDAVKDSVLENPTRCKFDPKVLECKGAVGPSCLTPPQVEAARKIYGPTTNPRTKQEIYPGLVLGSELGWANLAGPQPFAIPDGYFKYVVFKNPRWDFKTLNFDSDVALADQTDNGVIVSTDTNLSAFFGHGGKILQYHGWSDPGISPLNSVNYYESVAEMMGGASKVKDSYRLFMMPGMAHCRGGDGVNSFDSISVMEQWVEKGKAPEQILASRVQDGKTERARPLCPYPQVATYKGTGSTDDAANFVCASGK